MKTIKESNVAEIIEKKSRFIAQIFYIESKEEAEKIILETKKKYYDAKHNCYAYTLYDYTEGEIYSKSSDDGEPSGTAGIPILSVIKGNELINSLIIVTRYFGGILLGTGGLVRAYKGATEKVVKTSTFLHFANGYEVKICVDYKNWDEFNYYCKNNGIRIIKTEFSEKIECIFEIPKSNFDNENSYYNESNIIRQKPIFTDF